MRRGPIAVALALCLTVTGATALTIAERPAPAAGAGAAIPPPPPPPFLTANREFEAAAFTGQLSAWTCDPGTGLTRPGIWGVGYAMTSKPTATSQAGCTQTVPVRPNTMYWLFAVARGGPVVLGTEYGSVSLPRTTDWTDLRTVFTTGPDASTVRVSVRGTSPGEKVAVDGVRLQGMDSTAIKPAGPPPVVVAGEQTSHSVRLSWVGTPGSSQYRVYEGDVLRYIVWNAAETVTLDGLQPATSYQYTVTALNAAGETGRSAPVSARTAPASAKRPAAVGTVTAESLPDGIRLRWKPVPGATDGYNIWFNGFPEFAWVYGTEYMFPARRGEQPVTTYTFRVSALNSAGEGPKSPKVRVRH